MSTPPSNPSQPAESAPPERTETIDSMLERLNNMTAQLAQRKEPAPSGTATIAAPPASATPRPTARSRPAVPRVRPPAPPEFVPCEPRSLQEAQLTESSIEELILKYLLARGEDSGQGIANQVKVPFTLVSDLISRMKHDQLIHYRGTTSINDYVIDLTDKGRERARRHNLKCTYYGAAPVSLESYCASVAAQSLQHQTPSREDLERAFSDLLINRKMFVRLGSAMNSGRGMFLFGYPGNGKTSIAERVTRAFGETIWIPRAIGIDGEIIRIFDPSQHLEAPLEAGNDIVSNFKIDTRWVRVKRPTIVVGGELTMTNLELSFNPITGINEAPFQLKSNCGTLVIDDFGRQRMSTDELLNRWIVPLEKRYDFLNLPSGKKVQVPFDQLVIFSTNLEPKDLVDDAFLRRIPYKIEVEDPSEEEFRQLFKMMCSILGFQYEEAAINYLIEKHYRPINRPFRCCQPRDLLLQVKNFCRYTQQPMELTEKNFDFAVSNYFSIM